MPSALYAGPALEKKYFGAWRASKGLAKAAAEKKKEEEAEPPKEEGQEGKASGDGSGGLRSVVVVGSS